MGEHADARNVINRIRGDLAVWEDHFQAQLGYGARPCDAESVYDEDGPEQADDPDQLRKAPRDDRASERRTPWPSPRGRGGGGGWAATTDGRSPCMVAEAVLQEAHQSMADLEHPEVRASEDQGELRRRRATSSRPEPRQYGLR